MVEKGKGRLEEKRGRKRREEGCDEMCENFLVLDDEIGLRFWLSIWNRLLIHPPPPSFSLGLFPFCYYLKALLGTQTELIWMGKMIPPI